MVEATIEDLAIAIRSSRATIWGHPYIVGDAVWYHGNQHVHIQHQVQNH
jgi:hypothetical protein